MKTGLTLILVGIALLAIGIFAPSTSADSSKNLEYAVLPTLRTSYATGLRLNRLGRDGWTLVAVSRGRLYLSRPLP